MKDLINKAISESTSYQEYRSMIDHLLADNRTTGSNQSEAYLHYTTMNVARMNRLDKHTTILEEANRRMQSIRSPQTWLIITEAWCGDAAQVIPVIQQLGDLNDQVSTCYVLRDKNPELMDHFLTNGGRSIPKIIVLDAASNEVLGSWGPRPSELQQMVMDNKYAEDPLPYTEFGPIVQKWYAQDKTASIQNEFTAFIMQLQEAGKPA